MQTAQINEWFATISPEHQADIAFFTISMLEDDFDMSTKGEEHVESLIAWLTTPNEFEYRTLGKALSFVAVFENVFGHRFTPEGWERPKALLEQVIADAPDASMVETAKTSLDDLPRKQKDWKEIGESWQAAKAKISFEVPLKRDQQPKIL